MKHLPVHRKLNLLGYFGMILGLGEYVDKHWPLFVGTNYKYDSAFNLADAAICFGAAVAFIAAKGLKDLEEKLNK